MARKIGKQTVVFDKNIAILNSACCVGKVEGEGPLSSTFDLHFEDDYLGQKTYEAAESEMIKQAISTVLKKSQISQSDIDIAITGDLLDQSIASTFAIKDFCLPHFSVFSACSASALEMGIGAIFIESGAAKHALCTASSHFCTAERQFRFPLTYGSKRTPNSQRTVTGAGAFLLAENKNAPQIKAVTFGKIKDYDITDANNMGAAMAPAAADTIKTYFEDTSKRLEDFDLILTGDLGKIGSKLVVELLKKEGIDISKQHDDCGLIIFDLNDEKCVAGGSGCGCSASVFAGHIMQKLKNGEIKKMLFCATGALLSPTSQNQGLSIPSVAHLVEIEGCKL